MNSIDKKNSLSLYYVPKEAKVEVKERRRRGSNLLISGDKAVYRVLPRKQGSKDYQQIQVVTSLTFE